MMTRSKGYNGLIEALLDDRQDGAMKILLEGLQQPESKLVSATSISQLLNMRVQLANYTKSLNDVFPDFTSEDAKDLLQNGELKQELKEISRKGSLEIKLDGELPLTSDLYIPRLLSNRLRLNPRVFSLNSCEDVFVFTNISRMELAQLVKPHATLSSTKQQSLVTGRHIYLDDEEDWDDLVAISKSPIHLISKEGEGYVLQRTTKATDVLHNHVLREGRSKEAFVTEDAFLEELVSDNVSKGALICDVPGMGKTWLMQSLAAKIRDKNENFVVFYIDLPSFRKFLTAKDSRPSDNQALAVVLNSWCNSKLASHLLQKYAARNPLKIVFVLDGYDELNKEDMEIVKSNLLHLSKIDHISIIVSARPNMREFLQKSFNLISHDILPFQTEEQVRCIVEHWANVRPRINSESCELEDFALKCIQSVKSIQKDDVHDFLGVPLKCRILATVNEQQAKRLCKARPNSLQFLEVAAIKSVFDLYTVFVDCLVDKLADKMSQDSRNDVVNGIFTFYTQMALELLFPDLSIVYLCYNKFDTSLVEVFCCLGLACFNHVKQRFEFIHRSFAEYFVGRFFAAFWNDIEKYSALFVQMVGSYFIKNIMVAADVVHKINLGQNVNDLFMNFINRNGTSSNSPILVDKRKWFHLKYPLILLFMNFNGTILQYKKSARSFRKIPSSIETVANLTTRNAQPLVINTDCDDLYGLKRWLAESSFMTMAACIEEQLANILTLYIHILISFFDLGDRVTLLLYPDPGYQNIEIRECAAWLLCRTAMSKSPEIAVELFTLFGDSEENFLSVLCQRYPEEYWSPLEVAIETEDLDMIHYFVDKICLPFHRLFFRCISNIGVRDLAESDVDARLKIMKTVLGSSDRVLNFFSINSLNSYRVLDDRITKYSFQLLLKFFEDSERSIRSIISVNKRYFLEKCLRKCNDEELVNLLLSLYGKSDDKNFSIANLAAGRTFRAKVLLDALDLVEVRNAFSKGKLDSLAFSNCLNLETLKVLVAIQPHFSACNYSKWNYLHVAADVARIDWVAYLIKSGYKVDQVDDLGYTPLLRASVIGTNNLKSFLAVTRLFVENGANAYAKDRNGRNVAHYVFRNCQNAESTDLCIWVSYLLESRFYQLWEIKDDYGYTPLEILIHYGGKNSPITTDILRLLESYSVVSKS